MKIIYIFMFAFLLTANAFAQVAVIANKSVKTDKISKNQLLDFYIGDVKKWNDGQKVVVFDLKTKSNIKETFYDFLGKSTSRMKSIWMKNMLTGEGDPPEAMESEQDMMQKVSQTEGSIGFMHYDSVGTEVKILMIIEFPE